MVRIVNDAHRCSGSFFRCIPRDERTSLTSISSSGASEWLAFIDRTRLGSMEDTFVSSVRKLMAWFLSISTATQWNSTAIYIGILTCAIYRLYTCATEGARGLSIDSQGRCRAPFALPRGRFAFMTITCGSRAGPRSRREFLAISITYAHTWLKCIFSFPSFSISFFFFLLAREFSSLRRRFNSRASIVLSYVTQEKEFRTRGSYIRTPDDLSHSIIFNDRPSKLRNSNCTLSRLRPPCSSRDYKPPYFLLDSPTPLSFSHVSRIRNYT